MALTGNRSIRISQRTPQGRPRAMLLGFAMLAIFTLLAGSLPARVAASPTQTATYIVRLKNKKDLSPILISEVKRGIKPTEIFSSVFPGFQARLTPSAYQRLKRNRKIGVISRVTTFSIPRKPIVRGIGYVWGLDRIDQRRLPLNSSFSPKTSGRGVTAYVIDTGVDASHPEFNGRVSRGFSAVDQSGGATDCHGHGTHVAGTVGGSNVGVANQVNIVPIKVLSCQGRGTTAQILRGMDAVVQLHQPGTPAVANLSLGGGVDPAIDAGIRAMVAHGITVVVAAGNSNRDACNFSPARESAAITVGATSQTDTRASFSNYGSCLDVFAPGVEILSSMPSRRYAQLNGTSMAAPHVAGVVALALETNPTLSPRQVELALVASATTGEVVSPGPRSANRLIYSELAVSPPPTTTTLPVPSIPTTTNPVTAPPQAAPSPVGGLRAIASGDSVILLWNAPSSGGTPSSFVVEYKKSTDSQWKSHPVGTSVSTSTVISGLSPGSYVARVAARNAAGTSVFVESSPVNVAPQSTDVSIASSTFRNPWTRAAVSTLELASDGGQVSLDLSLRAGSGLPTGQDVVQGQLCPAGSSYPSGDGCTGSLFPGESANGTSGTYGGLFILGANAKSGTYYATVDLRTREGTEHRIVVPTTIEVLPKPAVAPGPLSGLTATVDGSNVNLTWTAPTDDGGAAVADYLVQYWVKGGSSWTTVSDGVSNATRATVSSLPTNIYSFRVAAVNSAGTGSYVQTPEMQVGSDTTTIISDKFMNSSRVTITSITRASSGFTWVRYEVRLRDSLGRLPTSFGGQLCPESSTYPFGDFCTGSTFGRSGTGIEATYEGLFGFGSNSPTGPWKVTFDPIGRIESPRRLTVR